MEQSTQRSALDFAFLREEGVRHLERLAGSVWTDYNTHDPGITILEQVCYALTDLAYRASYDLPELLAGEGADPYASLYTPAQILPTSPVTLDDLRKLVIDVRGVKNAWIDIVDEPAALFDSALDEVSHPGSQDGPPGIAAERPNVSQIRLKGLYRVSIEKSDLADLDGGAIRRQAARRLHRFRPLCEDFHEIRVLDQQPIRLGITLEIEARGGAVVLLADIYQAIAAYMSPAVPFRTLQEMLERGRRVDEIFEGPLLEHGFIDSEELARVERRTTLRVSDLIHELMSVPGVKAVKNLHFIGADGEPSADWLLAVDPDKTPRFDPHNSDIRIERRGLRIDDEGLQAAARALFAGRARQAANPAPTPAHERDLRPPRGRDRKIASYQSVQLQFPAVYGIGPGGLPDSASPERKAQAKQLKAYLMFYDQLLANHFAQLANAAKLFSFHDTTADSYFSQVAHDDGRLGLEALRMSVRDEHQALLRRITEGAEPGVRRRNRFLDHLLARFGEHFREYSLLRPAADAKDGVLPEERLAERKRALLRDYPRLGRDRGAGFNCLAPAGDGAEGNISGLELALRRKLGVDDEEERFYLVEHILLRPVPGDMNQRGPLLRDAASRDPYSLQLSVVFPQWPQRYQDPNFKSFVERTVREETPVHLVAHVVWKKTEAEMQAFKSAYAAWLERWRDYRLGEPGL